MAFVATRTSVSLSSIGLGLRRIRRSRTCSQIEAFRPGLLALVLQRTADGEVIRRAGVMGVVEEGGWVLPGDRLVVIQPASYVAMQVV